MAFTRQLWRRNHGSHTSSVPTSFGAPLQPLGRRFLVSVAVGCMTALGGRIRPARASMVATVDQMEMNLASHAGAASVEVEKRATDNRLYKAVTLANGMRVLLISDKDATRGAAALDVHVGSFSDPTDLPGLAHFAEHMCFLGTKKYPEEEEFSKFLGSHGGSSNAYTDSEDTVYYFDCAAASLDGALDRFSQFFVAPLFTESAVARELNAIDSEHSKNINNDGFRLYQLERDSSNPAHPLNKFSTGNKDTLDTIPKSQGINIRDRLMDFHRRNYVANQMTLCVLGKEPLQELEKWISRKFSAVPSDASHVAPPLEWWGKISPYEPQQQASKLSVVPVGESRRLALAWPIWIKSPDMRGRLLRTKPEAVVAHLVGHEGAGSLRSLLISKGWANGVGAAISNDVSDLQMFEVGVDLTEEGYKHTDDVAEAIFSYISLLKDHPIPSYIFDEVEALSGMGFKFAEKSEPSSYVSSIAADMQLYAPRSYVSGSRLLNPDAGAVSDYLTELTVESCRLKVVSPALKGKTDLKGRYYGTDYKRSEMVAESDRWRKATSAKFPALHLPPPNELIPQNFDLLHKPASSDAERLRLLHEPPKLVREDGQWSVWHKPDGAFAQPRVYMILNLALPESHYTADFAVQSDLFTSCFLDSLSEYLYDARLAGLGFDLSYNPRGLQMVVSGYSDKMDVFAGRVLKRIHRYEPDQASFDRFKDLMERGLSNFKTRQPYAHASYYASQASESLQFPMNELKAALKGTRLKDLEGFLDKTMSKSGGTALVAGNIDSDGAQALVKLAEDEFAFAPLDESLRCRRRPVLFPVARELETAANGQPAAGLRIARAEPNEEDENSATSFYFQLPSRVVEEYVLVELLADVVEQSFYNSLRTQQQLGYIVGAGVRGRVGIRSLTFTAQSAVVDGEELTRRIESFLQEAVTGLLATMTDTEFKAFKLGIITKKSEPDQRLTSQCERLWGEVLQLPVNEPRFDRQQQEVAALKKVTKAQIQAFASDFLLPGGSKRRLLVSQITAQKRGKEFKRGDGSGSDLSYVSITNEEAFRKGRDFI